MTYDTEHKPMILREEAVVYGKEPGEYTIDVQLDRDNKTMVQPDVAILCDSDKKTRRCIYGAPDFVLEVISKSTRRKDFTKKMSKYMYAGVREYWILDPYKRVLVIFNFEKDECPIIGGLDKPVPIGIYDGELVIDFTRVNQIIDEYERKETE